MDFKQEAAGVTEMDSLGKTLFPLLAPVKAFLRFFKLELSSAHEGGNIYE